MAKKANPDVGDALDPEMADLQGVPYVDAPAADEAPEPVAEAAEQEAMLDIAPLAAGEAEPTSRRSRRQRAADRGERQAGPVADLDKDENFRAYKAKRDAEVESERRRRTDLERQWEEQQRLLQQQQMAMLNRQLNETVDDDQRGALIENIAALRGQSIAQQWLQWESHKKARIEEEGLDPADDRFQKQYVGSEGGLQFERDLLAASKERLTKENAELKKAASPSTIQELVRQELARALHDEGLDYTDTGTGGAANADDAALQRDIAALNAGRMKAAAFAKKWGDR